MPAAGRQLLGKAQNVGASEGFLMGSPGVSGRPEGQTQPGRLPRPFFSALMVPLSTKEYVENIMAIRIKARHGESVAQLLRRFKKLCEKEGLTRDIKRRQYFEKPSERRRRDARRSVVRTARGGGDSRSR